MQQHESKLRQKFEIYYLDQYLLGEIAYINNRHNNTVYTINNAYKIIKCKDKKVYPPELVLFTRVRYSGNQDIESVYLRAQKKLNRLENKIYNKLLPYKGKGKLFIRTEHFESNKSIYFIFKRVIHVVKY